MLNLLISILGDSFDKFHQASSEIDVKEMIEVILQIESIYLWKRPFKDRYYIHVCEEIKIDGEFDEWEGKIKVIEKKIDNVSKQINTEFEDLHQYIDKRIGYVDEKLESLIRSIKLRKKSF